jgi:hypothetical protein
MELKIQNSLEVPCERLRLVRPTQAVESTALDLADTLPGQSKRFADLSEGFRLVVVEPESELENPPLTVRQLRQGVRKSEQEGLAENPLIGVRKNGLLEEIAKFGVTFHIDRFVERQR